METVVVLDYGMSNLRSVAKALEHVSHVQQQIKISAHAEDLRSADRIVFPGQGAIGACMKRLVELQLIDALRECIDNKPFLGICLGLQSLMEYSEEDGGTSGLAVFAGKVTRFQQHLVDPQTQECLKIPHMGWNEVRPVREHPLWQNIPAGERFYFVHSYHVCPTDPTFIAASTDYGLPFTSALARENVFAVQFHPEKSQRAGLQLLKNFLYWNP